MISFKQFLAEVIKDRKTAADEILNKTHDRRNQIPTDDFVGRGGHEHAYLPHYAVGHERHFYKIRNVPIHTIKTIQDTVDKNVVAQKILGTWNKGLSVKHRHDPRIPVFIKDLDGTHYLQDGNHRTIMRAARGFTHMRGLVLDVAEWRAHRDKNGLPNESMEEAIRSRDDADKSLKKKSWFRDQIKTKRFIKKTPYIRAEHLPYLNKHFTRVERVPLHNIVSDQPTVSKKVVSQKIQGTWNQGEKGKHRHDPRLPMFVKLANGKHYLYNGNHRVAARAERGFTHIRGRVADHDVAPKKPGVLKRLRDLVRKIK